MLCITRTKDLPGSISTKLKIRGILIPTLATPYVAIIILLFAVVWVSNRENLDQFNKSLDNISSIDNFN